MKTLFTLLLSIFLSFSYLSAGTIYTTNSSGNINGSIWSPSTPTSPLAAGDEMIINHAVILNADFTVFGKMTINSGASLSGNNKKLKIGEGGTTGELVNNGTLVVKDLNVKGDDSVINLTAPSVTNNGSISAAKIHVGDNAGAGILTNNIGGTITTSGDLHLDNILTNLGTLFVGATLKVHGGTVQGGGGITNCLVEFSENNGRPGTLLDQDICCDFTDPAVEPSYQLGGSTEVGLIDFVAVNGISSAAHFIHDEDFYSCGFNSAGVQLPVDLVDFRAKENQQHHILLTWTTESETNNKNFVIERAPDGRNYEALGVVLGSGSSTTLQHYSFEDSKPIPMAYYRLQQVDYDGSFEFSNILVVEMASFANTQIDAFPTNAENEITLRFTTFDTRKSILRIINSFGSLLYEEEIYTTNSLEYRTIDLSRYQNGLYNISLSDGFNFTTKSFVVNKTY